MSQTQKYEIRCPKCGLHQSVELYESVNVKESPELKARLMANELNTVSCTDCKTSFRIDKPLLYNDPVRGVLIYLIPLAEDAIEEGEKQFSESMRRLNGMMPGNVTPPSVSLVFNRIELVERIFLFDAGLSERLIEYIKYLIYSKNGEKIDPEEKLLLFDAEDSTDKALCFVVQDAKTHQFEAVLNYDRKTYTALSEMFDRDEQTATLLELFPGPYISARALFLRELRDSQEEAEQEP